MLSSTTPISKWDLKDSTGHQVSQHARQRLLRFLKATILALRYRSDFYLAPHAKVSGGSASAMLLCYLLFHSVRPDTYLKGASPAEFLYAHPQQLSGILSGSCKKIAQALSCKAFLDSSTKLAQSMVYPEHIWDQRNFACCFQAMLEHIELQTVARSGAWSLSAPWGHWQATPAYARHLRSNPLGVAGEVLGIMESRGAPFDIY